MLRPLIRLMGRLSLSGKFSLIGVLFTLAMVYLTASLFSTTQTNIDFSAKERSGVDYIAALPRLIDTLQHHRDVAAAMAAGDAAAAARLAAAGDAVEQSLATLDDADRRQGEQLITRQSWQGIQSAWVTLKRTPPSADGIANEAKLIAQALALLGQACDNSNLTLDPDIDSYYLMDNACSRLPTLLTRLGEQRAAAVVAFVHGKLEPAERTRLIELRPLAQDAADALLGNYAKVFGYNASLAPRFASASAALDAAQKKVAADVATQLLGDTLGSGRDALVAAADAASDQAVRLGEQSRKALDELLVARISRMTQERNLYVAVACITLLVTVLLFVAMYRSLVGQLGGEPVYAFDVVQHIAEGRLDTTINLKAGDDSSLLAAMNGMRDRMRSFVAQILQAAADISLSAQELNNAAGNIAVGSQRQSESAAAVAAAIEQLTVSISHSADNAGEAHQLSQLARDVSNQGKGVIGEAVNAMNAIALTVREAARSMQQLEQQSGQIGGIVNVIKEIADQTNLLALNASIEAARAGEMGRGFAVVADEVRQLAERTTQSTSEVKAMVSTIQDGTREVSRDMDKEVKQAELGVTHASGAGEAISTIRDNVDRTAHVVSDISSALSEQRAASTAVAQNIEKIAQMSEENNAAVQQTARSAHHLSELASMLKGAVSFFRV